MKKNLYIFIGLPASGKGTQIKILQDRLGIKEAVGVGNLIREIIKKDEKDSFALEVKERIAAGIPQPDSVANRLISDYLLASDSNLILDNYPFTQPQAEFLKTFIDQNRDDWQNPILIYINVSAKEAISRAVTRKTCEDCKEIYPNSSETTCPKCGGKLFIRTDDNVETVSTRISHYLPKIEEVVKFFKDNGYKVLDINGEQSIENVSTEISQKLNK